MSVARLRLHSEFSRQALLCLVAVLVHAGTLRNDFVQDACSAVRDNAIVAHGSVAQIATTDYWVGYHGDTSGLYRPLTVLSFSVNRRLLGPGPVGYHLVDLLLHALATLLLYRLLRCWSGRSRLAAWAALVFAVHPVQSEAVASIVGRADLLAAACTFAAAHLHLRGRDRGGWDAPVGAALALGLGLLSKESAICAPALLALTGAHQYRGFAAKRHSSTETAPHAAPAAATRRPRRAAVWALYLAVVAVYLGMRQAVLGGLAVGSIDRLDNPLVELGPVLQRLNASAVAWRYAGLLAFPANLCADYSYAALPLVRSLGLAALLPLAAGLVVAGLLAATWHVRPWAATGIAWLALALLPVANLVLPIGTIMAERLLYLPLAGFALALAAVVDSAPLKRAVAVPAGLVAAVWVVLAVQRESEWRSDYTVFAQAVKTHPGSARAWRSYGRECLARGQEVEGLAALGRALRILPDYHEVRADLAVHLLDRGQAAPALAQLDTALNLAPGDPTLWYSVGLAYYHLGQRAAAGRAFARAVDLDTSYVKACYNLGVVLLEEGRLEEAASAFAHVLTLQPEHPEASSNLRAVRQALERRLR